MLLSPPKLHRPKEMEIQRFMLILITTATLLTGCVTVSYMRLKTVDIGYTPSQSTG